MIYVMYSRSTGITGRNLIYALNQLTSELDLPEVIGGQQLPRYRPELLIRWGNATYYDSSVPCFNSPNGINNCANKISMIKVFKDQGVPSPRTWTWDEFRNINFPVIVRGKSHYKGKEFYEVNSNRELMEYANPHYYAVEPIDIDTEYRVFVFDGKVMEINKKEREGIVAHQRNVRIRNLDNGWICRRGGFEVPDGIRTAAKAAALAVEVDCGACDVYVDTNGVAGVFEINSAPGLNQRKLTKVAARILQKYYGPLDNEIINAALEGR